MDTFSFENLNAYKESKSLVVEVYRLIAKFPQSERFALSAQFATCNRFSSFKHC